MSEAPRAPTEGTGNAPDELARRHFRRNASMLETENAGFLIAIAFVGTTTVLPTFVTRLGGSALLVGLISTCQSAGWLLPQLVGARLCAGKPRMVPYILGPLYVGRPAFLALAAAAALLGTRANGTLLGILFAALTGGGRAVCGHCHEGQLPEMRVLAGAH